MFVVNQFLKFTIKIALSERALSFLYLTLVSLLTMFVEAFVLLFFLFHVDTFSSFLEQQR